MARVRHSPTAAQRRYPAHAVSLSAPAEAVDRLPLLTAGIAKVVDDLITPALVIDLDAVAHNIDAFIRHVGSPKRWRPHVKTVKQGRIIRMLMKRGVTQFKCATVDELALILDAAERVDPDGRVDAFLAYPLHKPGLRAVAEMIRDSEGARVRLLADSPSHLDMLEGWLEEIKVEHAVDVLVDVDVGMGRTGSPAQAWAEVFATERSTVNLVGVHGYEGHLSWTDRSLANTAYDELVALLETRPSAKKKPGLLVTSGTHSFDHALQHAGLRGGNWAHQVSPGTLVLSDLRSAPAAEALGLRQAAFVASRVVSSPGASTVTLDAGSKALNPDCPAPGCAVLGHPELTGRSASEEHRPFDAQNSKPSVGELLWLVPEHVCTTVNLHRAVHYVDDRGYVGRGSIEAMSRSSLVRDRRP